MATDDQQVLVTGQESAPASFRIPGNGQIRPKTIYAKYDGSGAGSSFLPALKIVSDGGELVGVYPTCQAVAAGGSAGVGWFPWLDDCCCANQADVDTPGITSLTSPTGTLTVANPSGPTTNVDMPATGVTAATYGDSTHVGAVTVDAEGRITAASNVAISSSGGITDLTSTGSTITVTAPTGPTTNVDLPTTGVTPGSYGDASDSVTITVDAEGRITAASQSAINAGGTVTAADGWIPDTSETWTFASFTAGPPAVGTFTVSGDVRTKYDVGTRIRLVQTTTKYFVVSAAPTFAGGNTTVTISGGTDYTLANAAISSNYHSDIVGPQGFPFWFAFNSALTGTTSVAGSTRFSMIGRAVMLALDLQAATSNATTKTITLPVTPANIAGMQWIGHLTVEDNSLVQTTPGEIVINANNNTASLYKNCAAGAWTNTNLFFAVGSPLTYEA